MEAKKLKFTVNYIEVKNNEIIVQNETVNNGRLLHILKNDIQFFYIDESGNSFEKSLKIGSVIECDYKIISGFLNNVKII